MSRSKLQNTLHDIIFGTESPLGKAFDVCLIVAICISVLAVILDSVNLFNQRYDSLLLTLEWSFTILFTIEYIAIYSMVNKMVNDHSSVSSRLS